MKKYIRRNDLVWEEIDNGLVILDHEKGKIYTLNRTAKEIWQFLEESHTLSEVCKYMGKKYNNEKIETTDIKKIVSIFSE